MKKKHIIFLVSGLFIIVAIIVIAILLNKKVELPKLKVEDIERIYCDEFDDNDIQLDIEEFLGYYNQIYDIRNNKKGEGTTPASRIIIELKDGTEIGIYNSGDQFEVNFINSDGKICQYWGKQQEIANMLYHGVYGLN